MIRIGFVLHVLLIAALVFCWLFIGWSMAAFGAGITATLLARDVVDKGWRL